ncbi:MAG: metallophosphoesterase family protein, partial [Planctomycetia bacterium]
QPGGTLRSGGHGGRGGNRGGGRVVAQGPHAGLSVALGRPTDRGVTLNVLGAQELEVQVAVTSLAGEAPRTLPAVRVAAGRPTEVEVTGLAPATRHAYRLRTRTPGEASWRDGPGGVFHTQRAPGQAFTFTVQGDSHPERQGRMFEPDLYEQALANVAADAPDFHILMGDDFSLDPLISRGALEASAVQAVYARQRGFLGIASASAALFLVNGNHECVGTWLLDGTDTNAAVLAGRARNAFFSLPASDGFYSADPREVEHVGLLRDYYAWTWGDALFVVLDAYWHSPVAVDHESGQGGAPGDREAPGEKGERGGKGEKGEKGTRGGRGGKGAGSRDLWQVTIGDAQYRWLAQALASSKARWKIVLSHHVMGTGRGGIELAGDYEWGGRDPRGDSTRMARERPGWELPIHQLMARHGVSLFLQGHDHLYARQQLDGVTYQEVPCPADATYTAFNREAYRSGDILPNSGHLRVKVSATQLEVAYVRAVRAGEEQQAGARNGEVSLAYRLPAPASASTTPADAAPRAAAPGSR